LHQRKQSHPVSFNYLASFATLLPLLLRLQAETQPIANNNSNGNNNNNNKYIYYTCVCNTQANPATLRLYCSCNTKYLVGCYWICKHGQKRSKIILRRTYVTTLLLKFCNTLIILPAIQSDIIFCISKVKLGQKSENLIMLFFSLFLATLCLKLGASNLRKSSSFNSTRFPARNKIVSLFYLVTVKHLVLLVLHSF